MKQRNNLFLSIFFVCLAVLLSCDNFNNDSGLIPCPPDIAGRALEYAIEYANADTEYELGGQDLLRSIKIDCSGLVVNCYNYAVEGTGFSLPFRDAAVINFYREWTMPTTSPGPGDLIFMGDDSNNPGHISFFVKKEGGNIYFVDSTSKPEEGINGVSERFYPESDERFLSFGVLMVVGRT